MSSFVFSTEDEPDWTDTTDTVAAQVAVLLVIQMRVVPRVLTWFEEHIRWWQPWCLLDWWLSVAQQPLSYKQLQLECSFRGGQLDVRILSSWLWRKIRKSSIVVAPWNVLAIFAPLMIYHCYIISFKFWLFGLEFRDYSVRCWHQNLIAECLTVLVRRKAWRRLKSKTAMHNPQHL